MSDYDDYERFDDDWRDEVIGTYRKIEYYMDRKNGELLVTQVIVTGIQHRGQDWGEADFESDEFTGPPSAYKPAAARVFEEWGKSINEGEHREYSAYELQAAINGDDEDDDDD